MDPKSRDTYDARVVGPRAVERYRADDVEKARELGGQVYYPQRLLVRGPDQPLRMEMAVTRLGQVTIGSTAYSGTVRIECGELESGYNVNFATAGRVDATAGGHRLCITSESAGVFNPVDDTTLDHWPGNARVLGFKLDRALVENTYQALTGEKPRRPIVFANSLDLRSPGIQPWLHMLRAFVPSESNPISNDCRWLIGREASSMLAAAMLLSVSHSYSEQLASSAENRTSESTVRRAAAMLEAHPEDAWSMEDLARATGVAVRTLESAFRKHLGTTPREFLRATRLVRIHEDLCSSDPTTATVADIAYRWGITHLGRFAAAYKQQYGCLPSETLQH